MDNLSVEKKMVHDQASNPLTILFFPFGCYGPINQCIALGDILRRRGHRIVIVVDRTWQEKVAALGFEAYRVDLIDPTDENRDKSWTEFECDAISTNRQSSIVQLETYVKPFLRGVITEAKIYDKQILSILDEVRPHVIIQDNPVCFPLLVTSAVPFIRLISCNPLEIPGSDVPPTFSGLPQNDRSEWNQFRTEYDRLLRPIWDEFNSWVQQYGAPCLPDLQFNCHSKYANLYIYPREADYTEHRPLGPTWYRIDSSVRETDQLYQLPAALRDRPEGACLVYVSLGTIGCADVKLLQRLIDVLGQTVHRFIISKGPYGDHLKLSELMIGERSLPQTQILPLVDLVITHGGNNTVTEALHFGKPMILLPMSWDQHDNAQRMHEMAFGVRLDTYHFTDEDLLSAVDTLLKDRPLRDRMARLGEQIRQRDSVRMGADIIERVGYEHFI